MVDRFDVSKEVLRVRQIWQQKVEGFLIGVVDFWKLEGLVGEDGKARGEAANNGCYSP